MSHLRPLPVLVRVEVRLNEEGVEGAADTQEGEEGGAFAAAEVVVAGEAEEAEDNDGPAGGCALRRGAGGPVASGRRWRNAAWNGAAIAKAAARGGLAVAQT